MHRMHDIGVGLAAGGGAVRVAARRAAARAGSAWLLLLGACPLLPWLPGTPPV